jgi:isopentenyl diphosphate isomerase/L-lactate dehydrogenase-like FMN-dependent dehydrogenase
VPLATTSTFCSSAVRRGTDVVKALALAAKAVGLGRSYV